MTVAEVHPARGAAPGDLLAWAPYDATPDYEPRPDPARRPTPGFRDTSTDLRVPVLNPLA